MPREFLPQKRTREPREKALRAPVQDRMVRVGSPVLMVENRSGELRRIAEESLMAGARVEPVGHITD